MQQNSKCRLCEDKVVNNISECSILAKKEVKDQAWLGVKGDRQGIVQEIKIWPYQQMHKPKSILEN